MPTFDFEGRDPAGKAVTGKRLAQSADRLASILLGEGIIPTKINEVKAKSDLLSLLIDKIKGRGATVDELSLFARQMYALTKTGVTITSALRQLADFTRSTKMANALYGMVESLESGVDLVTSMKKYPKVFTPIMISMVRVGQESGQLDNAFLRLNQYLELEASGIKRIKTALRYPAIVFTILIGAIIVINLLVIPTFAKVFAQANIQLPPVTQFFISVSNFFLDRWPYIVIVLAIIITWVMRYLKSPQGKLAFDTYQLKIPALGSIIKRIILLRFAQAFAITIDAGIPLLEGLSLVGSTINNSYAENEIKHMRESILHGKNLTQSAAATDLFTSLELQMLSVSEETGQLSTMLEEVANFYRREVDYDLKRLNDIIEPTLIILIAGVVLILALSVYLPIWDMVKTVH